MAIASNRISTKFEQETYIVNSNFINGSYVEVLTDSPDDFLVECIDQDTQTVIHSFVIQKNTWVKSHVQYFVNFHIKVTNQTKQKQIFEHYYCARGKRVYIVIAASTLGDTIAWLPQIDAFSKKHQCKVLVATHHNHLFAANYPHLEFVKEGLDLPNIYAMYTLGLFYDEGGNNYPGEIDIMHHPVDFRDFSVAKIGADILGVPYQLVKPKLVYKKRKNIYGKYVCIAPHASELPKCWLYPGGWQAVVDFLNKQGYKVLMITYEKLGIEEYDNRIGGKLRGVIDKTGNYTLSDRMSDLANADLFIGNGSGLSWLAWAIGCKVVLISGFSLPHAEFPECERISTPDKKNICHGCFNKVRMDNLPRDTCPFHHDTDRMYECSKTITPKTVIQGIKRQLGLEEKVSGFKQRIRELLRA